MSFHVPKAAAHLQHLHGPPGVAQPTVWEPLDDSLVIGPQGTCAGDCGVCCGAVEVTTTSFVPMFLFFLARWTSHCTGPADILKLFLWCLQLYFVLFYSCIYCLTVLFNNCVMFTVLSAVLNVSVYYALGAEQSPLGAIKDSFIIIMFNKISINNNTIWLYFCFVVLLWYTVYSILNVKRIDQTQ